ncbi:hypothetical protein BHE74_00028301 [Ensete ventricosum]|nr:hypothetical protein BHE74_00028301 [Ensete ventricosum]
MLVPHTIQMRRWKSWELETKTAEYQFSHATHASHYKKSQAHLAPQSSSKFNFQKYIKRSLEEDFKVVVGIRYDD